MRFVCEYNYLLSNLMDLSEVVEDALLGEELKNVIFIFREDSVELLGVNQLIVFFRPLDHEHFTIDIKQEELDSNGVRYMQLRSKEVKDFLNSYKTVRRTKIEEVTFETMQSSRVKCTVLETDIENGKQNISSWTFTELPMQASIMQQINVTKPEGELTEVESDKIIFYTKNLLPLLQSGTSLYSKLTFSNEFVLVFSNTHVTFMKNVLPDALRGICLLQRTVSFMDKVICQAERVNVARDNNYLYFETDKSRAFIRYDNRLPNFENIIDEFSKNQAFSLDRIYLQDTLKRLKLLNESVEFTLDTDNSDITLKNSKFVQQIPMLQVKAMTGVLHFKVLPEVLIKAIVGSDDEFSSSLFVYYCLDAKKKATLYFTDSSNSWFSAVKVKPY